MFSYTICNVPDNDIFHRQCNALEKHIPSLKKSDLLTDVDGSQTQIYQIDGKEIIVHNSNYVGAVYIDSEIDIEQYF